MPKLVDYAGRFAFFELASFTLVRDHGVDRLSRHAMARVLSGVPSDADIDDEDEDGGPVHHRFAIASHGYVPPDVLHAGIEPPRSATSPPGSRPSSASQRRSSTPQRSRTTRRCCRWWWTGSGWR
ncbi:hypothetical protein Pve01_76720 [Planomonospora venezuelensis]|nr:hypothetical protein Pve01_76720 [Planomonospora venezuelensis]